MNNPKFLPDLFQQKAIQALNEGASVLVAAPTGSGKTFIAEHAISEALSRGKKSFYTAPIKALSNQKFRDFQELYGSDNVGLLTGDTSINSDAKILVMTTEVLRNMIYASSRSLENLSVVILDEVHFLQDQYRGPVWEEVIIHLPLEVTLVCLSATVSNAVEVSEWLTTVRGDTRAIIETKRPVSLEHHHMAFDKATGDTVMYPTLIDNQVNPRAKKAFTDQAKQASGSSRHGNQQKKGRQASESRFGPPNRNEVVEQLSNANMLPAIYFIFSRNQCDDAARGVRRSALSFATKSETEQIRKIAQDRAQTLSSDEKNALDFEGFLSLISTGVAAHHAGMVPIFKEIVEEAFTLGLLKVVFATETLAVGLNMPARTVVIDKLTRFTGENHVPLKPSDFTQLTGRAGRRGIDDVGHAVTLWSPFVGFDEVCRFSLNKSFNLTSAFRPTYNMTVNLVNSHSEGEVRHLLNLSFAQYQANSGVVTMQASIEKKREQQRVEEEKAKSQYGDIWSYRRLHGLQRQKGVSKTLADSVQVWNTFRPGDIIALKTDELINARDTPYQKFMVLATSNRRRGIKITAADAVQSVRGILYEDLIGEPIFIKHVDLDADFSQWNPGALREVARLINECNWVFSQNDSGDSSLTVDDDALASVDVANDPLISILLKHADAADRIRNDIERLERHLKSETQSVGASFDRVLELLRKMGYIDSWKLTAKGSVLAGVFHESDILIAEAISQGIFDGLKPIDLAAAVSCVVYERRNSDQDDLPYPSKRCREVVERVEDLSMEIQDIQTASGLPVHRFPDPNFAQCAALWAAGKSLTSVLDTVPEMSPGDFVRTIRQIVDLLRQMERIAIDQTLRESARIASEAMFRGIVVGNEAL